MDPEELRDDDDCAAQLECIVELRKKIDALGPGSGDVKRNQPLNLRSDGVGQERSCMIVASLIDTNVLVYRFDARFPDKQVIATEVLRKGIVNDFVRI